MAKYKVTHKRKMVNLTCMGKLYKRKRVTWDVKAPVLSLMFGFSVSSSSRARMGIVLLALSDFSGVYLSFQVYKVWCTSVDILLVLSE